MARTIKDIRTMVKDHIKGIRKDNYSVSEIRRYKSFSWFEVADGEIMFGLDSDYKEAIDVCLFGQVYKADLETLTITSDGVRDFIVSDKCGVIGTCTCVGC